MVSAFSVTWGIFDLYGEIPNSGTPPSSGASSGKIAVQRTITVAPWDYRAIHLGGRLKTPTVTFGHVRGWKVSSGGTSDNLPGVEIFYPRMCHKLQTTTLHRRTNPSPHSQAVRSLYSRNNPTGSILYSQPTSRGPITGQQS